MEGADHSVEGNSPSVPGSRVGVSYKLGHTDDILSTRPTLGWFEVHPENYMSPWGPYHDALKAVRQLYPLSLHGVGLSLGGSDPIDQDHLSRLAALVDTFKPFLVSEHLAWSVNGGHYFADLLPVPLNPETLSRTADRIKQVQDKLGRSLLIENPSLYLKVDGSTIPEPDFLGQLADATECGLLLDLNNVFVSAHNLKFDPFDYLWNYPMAAVGEIHLAGHNADSEVAPGLLVDDHGSKVSGDVWDLYEWALTHTGPIPTLIEWDTNVPSLETLVAEARKAAESLHRAHHKGSKDDAA